MKFEKQSFRKFSLNIHRDLGYFFSGLILIYSLSGIALNHIDDWNPDFLIEKKEIKIDQKFTKENINQQEIKTLGTYVHESDYKVYDFPTSNQVKIYYDNATFHFNMETGTGIYEKIQRRPLFYQANSIHKNSLAGWKWFSDGFAVMLVFITITGLFIARGKFGFSTRGKWLVSGGILIPVITLLINELT